MIKLGLQVLKDDLASALIAAGAFVALFRFKRGMISTLAGSVVVGAIYFLLARG